MKNLEKSGKKFFYALASMIGTIIGVGIFGLPYSFARAGFLVGLIYLLVLGGAVLTLHLFYGQIVFLTAQKHRLPGYAKEYLGSSFGKIIKFTEIIGLSGALLVYLIIGGKFLSLIFPGGDTLWALIFFALGSFVIYKDIRMAGPLELAMTSGLIIALCLISASALKHFRFENLLGPENPSIFFPYGIVFFSLTGFAAIPELKDIFESGKASSFKKIIIFGTLISIFVYFLFSLAVLGVSGKNTSEEAITGLEPLLGKNIVFLGALFGFLAVITSFFILGLNLKKIFWYDFGFNKNFSWLIASAIPLALFLGGLRNFIEIICLMGTIMGGVSGIAISLIHLRVRDLPGRQARLFLKTPIFLNYLLILLFSTAIIYQIISFFK